MERKKKNFELANSVLERGIQNKNAFTLIELLAIIVILAIIAVITVPIILNVIDNSKKGAIKDSVYGYKDAINKYYVSELYENLDFKLDGTYTITDKGRLSNETGVHEIPFTGTIPTGGYLTYENNILTGGCIAMDEYETIIQNGEIANTKKGNCKFAIYVSGTDGKTKGDLVKIGDTEEFYVISSDSDKTILLAHHNLGESLNQEEGTTFSVPFSSSNYWYDFDNNTFKAEYGTIAPANVYDENSNLYTYINNYKTKLHEQGATIIDARLLTREDALDRLGLNYGPLTNTAPEWVYSTNYWVGYAASNCIYAILYNLNAGYSYDNSQNNVIGIRPVIEIPTSAIELKS